MKRVYLPPLLLLALMLALSLWNSSRIAHETEYLRGQLAQAAAFGREQSWPEALNALETSYKDWQHPQTYLHIVMDHDVLDAAESMYHRAAAFARTEESAEFQAEIEHLRHQLTLMAEMERFSIKNVL